MRAALKDDGAPAGFEFTTAVGSITRSLGWGKVENGVERQAVEGLANCPYRADALKVLVNLKNTHVPVMFWRSVGSSQNAFAVESFIDEARPRGRSAIRSNTGARCLQDRPGLSRRARRARRQGRLGQAPAQGRRARPRDPRELRHDRRRDRRGLGQGRRASRSSGSSPASTAAIWSIR